MWCDQKEHIMMCSTCACVEAVKIIGQSCSLTPSPSHTGATCLGSAELYIRMNYFFMDVVCVFSSKSCFFFLKKVGSMSVPPIGRFKTFKKDHFDSGGLRITPQWRRKCGVSPSQQAVVGCGCGSHRDGHMQMSSNRLFSLMQRL